MEYIIIGTLLAVIGVAIWVYISKKNSTNRITKTEKNQSVLPINQVTYLSSFVSFQSISDLTTIDENNLFEIKDISVISRISNTLLAIIQGGANNFSKNAVKEVLNNPNLYIVLTKNGEKLNKVTNEGVQYAMSKSGFGRLQKVDPTQVAKAANVATGVATVMNIGSLVVGQYYMTEINNKLEDMGKSLDKISDFQEREFKSRILSLIDCTSNISHFSAEIMENDNIRYRYLQTLVDLDGICIDLLLQVNISINDIINKSQNSKYQEYEKYSEETYLLIQY